MKVSEYTRKLPSTEKILEDFLKLPNKSKLLIIDYLRFKKSEEESFDALDIYDLTEESIESPIEQIFYNAFNIVEFEEGCLNNGYLFPQFFITANGNNYRCDFAYVDCEENPICFIECDGHDYHSSKTQIAKDNKKNMDLKISGYDVIRFSGSQIFSDPYSCALDAYKFIKIKLNGGGIDEGC